MCEGSVKDVTCHGDEPEEFQQRHTRLMTVVVIADQTTTSAYTTAVLCYFDYFYPSRTTPQLTNHFIN